MKTTLNQIRACSPCESGWKKLLANIGKTKSDDEPLSIIAILDSNGLDDALWCLRAVEAYEREKRLYAVRCARAVQHLMTDQRSIDAIDVAERFANGEATADELADAMDAASYAAWSAMDAARSAAWSASDAARSDESSAAWSARDAARAAAWSARDAARAALGDVQEKDLRQMCAEIEARETTS
ncbi:hypothetical protein [Undibacterium sp.]|uniref:hypothetical protein n=1 Tax=Undibacterium sp. TaxID=1914977 RepID=UPI0037532ED5